MAELVESAGVTCSCCGQSGAEADVVRLLCHEDIAVCGRCVHWMSGQVQARPALTPILPVRDMGEAREFWLRTGVAVELYDDGYALVSFGGSEIAHLALHPDLDPARNMAACYMHVADAHAWHRRWREADLPVGDLVVQPWGMVEFRLLDPNGNLLRVGHPAG